MGAETKLILSRIQPLFKRMFHYRYGIIIADDTYGQTYNIFFTHQKKGEWCRSTPIHSIKIYRLDYLEKIIHELRQQSQLTITFVGFNEKRWPSNLKPIK